jgi:hypothetical protein
LARSEAPLVLETRASRGFRLGLVALAAAALGAVLMADLPLAIAPPLALFVALATLRAWRSHAWAAALRLRLSADGMLDWRDAAGAEGQGRLASSARVGPLVALEVREPSGKQRRIALWRDMLDADAWRRLQVALARRPSADSYNDRA